MLDIPLSPATLAAMKLSALTPEQLRKAADVQENILELQNQLNELLGAEEAAPEPAPPVTEAPKRGRRKRKKVSAEAHAKMSAAAKARWAARRVEAQSKANPATEPQKPKQQRKISAAGRRAMSLAGKRRWAKARAEGKTRL